jgi:ABC-type oligopeptide transport system substrate-binding subunit
MNVKKYALLLVVVMLALASVAAAQRTKSKSKSKKPATVTAATASSSTPTQAAEHKTEGEVPRITVDELKEKLAKNKPVFIIDSRSQGSYDNSEIKIKGAVRIPMDEIEARLKEIPHDREIVVYCT